jgi:hypothetical protein
VFRTKTFFLSRAPSKMAKMVTFSERVWVAILVLSPILQQR